MIRVTDHDHEIMQHIEKYQATIQQIALMFYPHNHHNYYYARRRLKALYDEGLIKCYKHDTTGKHIYYIESDKELRKWSKHRLYLMDFYAMLVHHGAKIHYFNTEHKWLGGKYRSDGLFIFEYPKDNKWLACVEVDYFKKTNLEKYEVIFENNDFQQQFKTLCPFIFIINKSGEPYNYKFKYEEVENNVMFLDYNLTNFKEVVLD